MPRRFFGKHQPISYRHLRAGLSLEELFNWIESVPDDDESRRQNTMELNDAVRDLIAYGESAVEPIIERLLPSQIHLREWAAIWALREIGDQRAVEPLWTFYRSSKEIRTDALWTLSVLKDKRVFDVAVSLLDHENIYLRRSAIHVLGSLGDIRAAEILIPRLNPLDESIGSVIVALGRLMDKRAFAPLVVYTPKATLEETDLLIHAFGQIGASESIAVLKNIIDRRDLDLSASGQYGHLRCHAVDAIAQINHPDAVIVLRDCLNHSKRGVRRRARRALKKLRASDAPQTQSPA